MKRIARLTTLLGLVAAVVAGSLAGTPSAAVKAPTGLHGFLLTATAPQTSTFHRTPSFAWRPMSGAVRYELQLSISDTFRDNGIVYDVSSLQTPVASINTTLPWITGSPHSLYARVRAYFAGGHVSPWSADYGFDVVPASVPTPLPSHPGLLRWNTVEGADYYEVWLVDTGKREMVNTNVLDEREFYEFHNSQPWIGTVHWRVRSVRWDEIGRRNSIPASHYGAWSPTYIATNPAPTSGPINLEGTISDTISNGSLASPAHSLAPAFVWSGDQTLYGASTGLFRVEVFTDSSCVNRVFSSPVVSAPAYAPRMFGGLSMPTTDADITAAQGQILGDGPETHDYSFEGDPITPNEDMDEATPTLSIGSGPDLQIVKGSKVGAPIDLWDLKWPSSGYYWTVIPVAPVEDNTGNVAAWQDMELAQDVCAAGRVARFGIVSQPGVTRNQTPFASGLSASGKLASAATTSAFYGEPLVAWTPAPEAYAYEVQWGKNAYPFSVRGKRLTWDTSMVLPLKPGTWYYRVRGYDFNMPTGAQELAWSKPVKIVVSAPKFRILSAARR